MKRTIKIKEGVVTLTDVHGEAHTFKSQTEILDYTESVGMFALNEIFTENQVIFLIQHGA